MAPFGAPFFIWAFRRVPNPELVSPIVRRGIFIPLQPFQLKPQRLRLTPTDVTLAGGVGGGLQEVLQVGDLLLEVGVVVGGHGDGLRNRCRPSCRVARLEAVDEYPGSGDQDGVALLTETVRRRHPVPSVAGRTDDNAPGGLARAPVVGAC